MQHHFHMKLTQHIIFIYALVTTCYLNSKLLKGNYLELKITWKKLSGFKDQVLGLVLYYYLAK